jgi:hypothetical protein
MPTVTAVPKCEKPASTLVASKAVAGNEKSMMFFAYLEGKYVGKAGPR